MSSLRHIPPPKIVQAESLKDAYKKGYFSASMTRWELEERLCKYNPTFRIHSSATHRGLYDGDRFICGIGFDFTIPKFTITRYVPGLQKKIQYCDEWGNKTGSELYNKDGMNGYVYSRGWPEIFRLVAKKGYSIDLTNL